VALLALAYGLVLAAAVLGYQSGSAATGATFSDEGATFADGAQLEFDE
jgi:hypothetical protein